MKQFSTTIFFILAFTTQAQLTRADYYNTIDNKVYSFSKQKPNAPFDTIIGFVNANFASQEDKARAYYTWITMNIEYDEDYRGSSSYSLIKALRDSNIVWHMNERTLETRKAASEGMADLMTKFCHASKIYCYTVPGYIRQSERTISSMMFVWNVLYLDTVWVNVDVSMANGYLDGDYKFRKYSKRNYFRVAPSVFITNHFPHDPMWQLLDYPYSILDFRTYSRNSSTKDVYDFKDSLRNYQKRTGLERKKIDVARYFKYETDGGQYKQSLLGFYYDEAADKMSLGIDYYYKYYDIGENKLSKYPLKADWKKAKGYLDKAEHEFRKAENVLSREKLSESDQILDDLRRNLQGNMENVRKNQEYLEKLKPYLKDR